MKQKGPFGCSGFMSGWNPTRLPTVLNNQYFMENIRPFFFLWLRSLSGWRIRERMFGAIWGYLKSQTIGSSTEIWSYSYIYNPQEKFNVSFELKYQFSMANPKITCKLEPKQVLAPFFFDGSWWAKPVKQNQPCKPLGPRCFFWLDEGMNRKGVEEIMTYTIELITVAYLGFVDLIFGLSDGKIAKILGLFCLGWSFHRFYYDGKLSIKKPMRHLGEYFGTFSRQSSRFESQVEVSHFTRRAGGLLS